MVDVPDSDALLEAMDAAVDGIAVLDDDGRYVYVNRKHAELYGYDDPSALEGTSWRQLYDETELDRFDEEVLPRVEETGEWRGEAVGRRRDGERFDQVLTLKRLDGGGWVCTVRDVTDRKRTERQLRLLHEATRELMYATDEREVARVAVDIAEEVLDHCLTVCWTYDEEGDRLVPIARTEAVERMHDGDTSPVLEPDTYEMEVFERGEPVVVEDYSEVENGASDAPLGTVLMLPLGDHGVLHVGSTEVRSVADSERYVIEILARHVEAAWDRTERERRLAERTAALERQNERLEEFAGTLSHDLRNPLQVALTRVDALRADLDGNEHVESIERMLERMERLIEDVLRLARTGRTIDEPEPVDLADVARTAAGAVPTGGATVTVADDLGTVEADRDRLQELFENLLRNAVEHGSTGPRSGSPEDAVEGGSTSSEPDPREAGGHGVSITVGGLDEEEGFFVADDGPGIPPDERDEVFEHGYSTSEDGTGFGLSIVRGIADAHGWETRLVESDDGGARFEFVVSTPLDRATPPEPG